MKKTLIIIVSFLVLSALKAQTKTNLEKFYQLIDSSVNKTSELLKEKTTISLSVIGSSSLDLLKPKVIESFSKKGFTIKSESINNTDKVNYLLSTANVEYGDSEKDGFFGDVVCERNISLKGIATIITADGITKSVEIAEIAKDTVTVEEIRNLEEESLVFTQGSKPEVSFFSNLLEPILVVATLVTTVVLLFSVRGK